MGLDRRKIQLSIFLRDDIQHLINRQRWSKKIVTGQRRVLRSGCPGFCGRQDPIAVGVELSNCGARLLHLHQAKRRIAIPIQLLKPVGDTNSAADDPFGGDLDVLARYGRPQGDKTITDAQFFVLRGDCTEPFGSQVDVVDCVDTLVVGGWQADIRNYRKS